jgi:hypothetical protein
MLARPKPTLRRTAVGGALVTAMSLTAAVGAWSAQPEGPPKPVVQPVKWPIVIYAHLSLASEP